MHRGIDIAADRGTAVVAARSGTVTYAGRSGRRGMSSRCADGRYAMSYLHLGGGVGVARRPGGGGGAGRRGGHDRAAVGRRSRICTSACGWPAWTITTWIRCRCCLGGRGAGAAAPVPCASPIRSAGAGGAGAGRSGGASANPVRYGIRSRRRRPRLPAAAPDRGRPLVLGGLVLLALVLFGGVLVRANAAVNAARMLLRALRARGSASARAAGSVVDFPAIGRKCPQRMCGGLGEDFAQLVEHCPARPRSRARP